MVIQVSNYIIQEFERILLLNNSLNLFRNLTLIFVIKIFSVSFKFI